MHFPALPSWTRTGAVLLMAVMAAVATTRIESAHGQPSSPVTEHPAIPFVERDRVFDKGALRLLPPNAITRGSINTDSGPIAYTATAGTLPLHDQSGERTAAIFYVSYVANQAAGTKRPVTFVFNGGPGAASAYLHLGLAGPRLAEFSAGRQGQPRLHDNPQTWLQFTDLVMVDPVGSGFSQSARADGGNSFWGVTRDAEALAKFIAQWIADNKRADSPQFIVGASYGGFRAAKIASLLRRDHGIALAGIVMVSPLMEGAFTFGGTRFALGAAMQIPSLAAAQLERTGSFTQERLAEAERFALGEYLTTLASAPPRGDAAQTFYARVAEITGMPIEIVTRTRGFIRDHYIKNLRATEKLIVSRYDATFAVPDPYPENPTPQGRDPLLTTMTQAFSGAMSVYVREELGYKTDLPYVLLSNDANRRWDWGQNSSRDAASVDDDLRRLLLLDPAFRLLVVHGYTDMVTPYAVSRYVLDHLPDFPNPARVQLKLYGGGHMFYVKDESRRRLTTDAKSFYAAER
jgi:carboxypeptidase C (cathepsin A)